MGGPDNATKLRRIKKIKESTFQLIENINEWADEDGKTAKLSLLNSYLGQLNSHYRTYVIKHEETYSLLKDDEEIDINELIKLEEVFITAKATLTELIEKQKPPVDPIVIASVGSASKNEQVLSSSRVKLPKLTPPMFSGNYYDWLDFKNEFTSMIVDCKDITDVDRFRYLKSCLTGNASQSVSKMEASNDNFRNAWTALTDRYENKALIFQSHINEIIQLSATKKESAQDIRAMLDKVKAHYRALSSLGSMENLADNLLICLLSSKLDSNTIMKWEESTTKDIPIWIDFTNFLEKRACTLEKIDWNKQQLQTTRDSAIKENTRGPNRTKPAHSAFISANNTVPCLKCKTRDHILENCTQFITMDPTDRSKLVREAKLCIVCLKLNHRSRFCKAARCEKCGGRHHTMVHWTQPNNSVEAISMNQPAVHRAFVASESLGSEPALLATAVVNILNRNGEPILCRALLDCAATTNFISRRFAQLLGVEMSKTFGSLGGIAGNVVALKTSCALILKSRFCDPESFEIRAAVLPKIMDIYPPLPIEIDFDIPCELKLADPNFGKPQQIDLLLGAGIFWELLLDAKVTAAPYLPQFRETKLGWIVSGPLSPKSPHRALVCAEIGTRDESMENLENLVKRFWELDTLIPGPIELSSKDRECEDHFKLNTRRDETGRYIVRLPFSRDPSTLGQSIGVAMRRFLNLEKKLDKDPLAKKLYVEFMEEYAQLGHLEEVSDFDSSAPHSFLPHHCVLKPTSSSTKL